MEWIKISDRLPEANSQYGESDYVLCVDKYNLPFTAWYNVVSKTWRYAHIDTYGTPNPTHWMPLPELPKQ